MQLDRRAQQTARPGGADNAGGAGGGGAGTPDEPDRQTKSPRPRNSPAQGGRRAPATSTTRRGLLETES